jgi:hypothetical protein
LRRLFDNDYSTRLLVPNQSEPSLQQFEFILAQKQVYQKDGGLWPCPAPEFFLQ